MKSYEGNLFIVMFQGILQTNTVEIKETFLSTENPQSQKGNSANKFVGRMFCLVCQKLLTVMYSA